MGELLERGGGGGAKVNAPREPMAQRTQNLYSTQQKHQGYRHMPNKKLYGCFKAGARGSECFHFPFCKRLKKLMSEFALKAPECTPRVNPFWEFRGPVGRCGL